MSATVEQPALPPGLAEALKAALGPKPQYLPPLREELRLLPASPQPDGSPAWLIQDPINNRFFRITWLDFCLLARWSCGEQGQLIAAVNAETPLHVESGDIEALVRFLAQHSLLQCHRKEAVDGLSARAAAQKQGVATWLLHHYLFFRIPLVRPQAWLAACLPWLSWIYRPQTALLLILATLTGVVLVARQWETFATTFVDHLSWSGAAAYIVALAFAKCLHELGHAFTATRYGVRVAHMGVAMLVMFPMLYTDTSESWRLSNPHQRLAIAAAGIISELALAGLATLAWALLEDGPLRNALFFLATTSWVLTLAINLSPFMRFDGYFILSDLLDFPNLHERAIALARTAIRRVLLGWQDAWPEALPAAQRRVLIVFAAVTMIYRLVLYLGIALTVYVYFFKLLGIFLMLVECVWFIALPMWRELKVWWERRAEVARLQRFVWLLVLAVMLGLALWPWQTAVRAAGWLRPAQQQVIYAPFAGQVTQLNPAEAVRAGQALMVLEAPELGFSAARAQALAQAREREVIGLSGVPDGEARRNSLNLQAAQFQAEASAFNTQARRLQLTAPFAGELLDLDPLLAVGVWVQPRQPLAVVADRRQWVVEAFVSEADVPHLRLNDQATIWLPSAALESRQGKIIEIDQVRTQVLPHAMLDAQAGGPIPTVAADARTATSPHTPREALYRVRVQLNDAQGLQRMANVQLVIHGAAHAWLPRAMHHIAAIAVRESGF